jgi:alpha-beta hydrolase superfamily lysophospholipase
MSRRPRSAPRPRRTRAAVAGLVVSVSVGGTAVAASLALATGVVTMARKVVTPARRRSDDVRVLGHDPAAGTIKLSADADTRLPGRYSFWFDHGRGHARLGEVVSEEGRGVVRRVESVDEGDLSDARAGRIGGWLWRSPRDAGLPVEDVEVDTPVGPAPAWLVPAADGTDGRWMIGVHGRGVTRAETVRAAPVFHRAGITSLLVSYRNDGEAPRSADGRYALGDAEWTDVEAAMTWAVDHGATSIVLMGWSMGGATVLQAVTRAARRDLVVGVVLESPVVDWRTTLRYQGTAMRVPRVVQELAMRLLQSPRASRLSGRDAPVDLDRLDLVEQAGQLQVPVLLLHSDDDGFVPSTASHALAAARPDIVQLEVFEVARHTKIWNYDPERFESVIADWLGRLPRASARTGRSGRRSSAG